LRLDLDNDALQDVDGVDDIQSGPQARVNGRKWVED
jgi:hypothetical protein